MRVTIGPRMGLVMACFVGIASVLIFLPGMVSAQDGYTLSATEPDGVVPPWTMFEEESGPWNTAGEADMENDAESRQVFVYYQVAGATLKGRSSTTEYAYDGLGCIHGTAGTDRVTNIELILPDGATIKYLRLYYYDTSTTGNVRAFLTRYDPGSATSDLISTESSTAGNSGYGTSLSAQLNEVVDNGTYAYTIIGWPSANSSGLRVCGMRVAYYAP